MLPCGHLCPGKCWEECTSLQCPKIIKREFDCGHQIVKPCWELSGRYRCKEPCRAILECEHQCVGNCSKCRQGRMHVPCEADCERIRVCLHVCGEPCTKTCPPCPEKCENRCTHSRCPKQCMEPCTPCRVSMLICGHKIGKGKSKINIWLYTTDVRSKICSISCKTRLLVYSQFPRALRFSCRFSQSR